MLSRLYKDEFLSYDNDLYMKKYLFLIFYPIARAKFSRAHFRARSVCAQTPVLRKMA